MAVDEGRGRVDDGEDEDEDKNKTDSDWKETGNEASDTARAPHTAFLTLKHNHNTQLSELLQFQVLFYTLQNSH